MSDDGAAGHQQLRAGVPIDLGLAIVRALQPTALDTLRSAVARRVSRHPQFSHDIRARRTLELAVEDGDRAARAALGDLVGRDVAAVTLALDPRTESPVGSSTPAPRQARSPRRVTARSTAPPERAPVPRAVVAPDPPMLHRTVLGYGAPSAPPVRRSVHRRPRDEIQRWVADTRHDPPPILEVPSLDPDSTETERWRDEIKFGELECPWPACPEPKLVLKAGEIRATHVAHRANARDHGAHADWVLFTLARLATVAGTTPTAVAANPPSVRVDNIVFVLLHDRLFLELARAAHAALQALPPATTSVAVLRSSSLPRRSTALEVFGEDRPRWAFRTTRERTISAIRALEGFDHVLGAPERPDGIEDPLDPDPRWGYDWVGLGLERTLDRGQLDWRAVPRSPLVAVQLNDRTLRRVVRPAQNDGGAHRADRQPSMGP